jgi:hypothetical protein
MQTVGANLESVSRRCLSSSCHPLPNHGAYLQDPCAFRARLVSQCISDVLCRVEIPRRSQERGRWETGSCYSSLECGTARPVGTI